MQNLTPTPIKKYLSYFVLMSLFTLPFRGQSQNGDTTTIGVFITSINDLDYSNGSFSVDYLCWRINKLRVYRDYNLYEPSNAKEVRTISSSTDWEDQSENIIPKGLDTIFWDVDEFKTVFNHDFDLTNYPFDKEILSLDFISSVYYDNWVKLNYDSIESGLDSIKINGWKIGEMKVQYINRTYNTTFGCPDDVRGHVYSGFRILIPIERQGWLLFFKLFTGLVAAFTIALFSLKINITEADGRFGVCVGALFAALANMYIVNSNLPSVSKFTFMDQAHMITIGLITILFITSIWSLKKYKQKDKRLSKKIDRNAFWIAIVIFILANSLILLNALN